MIAAIAFHQRELPLMEKLARWITELGGVSRHEILLVPSMNVFSGGHHNAIADEFRKSFKTVHVLAPTGEDEYGWPDSANFAWRATVNHVVYNMGDEPFLWFEPDSVPLVSSWLDQIESEWMANKKPFMGARVQIDNIPVHMSGIAVYSGMQQHCPGFALVQYQKGYSGPQTAWDVQHRDAFLSNAHLTSIIQHEWKPEPFTSTEDLKRLNPGAVIYHQDKLMGLPDIIKADRAGCRMVTFEKAAPAPILESERVFLHTGCAPYPPNTIFTYFRPVEGIDENEQLCLIDLWKFSWRRAGWNPVVLTEHKRCIEELNVEGEPLCWLLPSVNPAAYDHWCYDRWVEMGYLGGFLADYDCHPNGLSPFPVPGRLTIYQMHNACPSLVGGPGSEFLRMAHIFVSRGHEFVTTEHGRPHVSDMHILQGVPEEYDQIDLVRAHGADGWRQAKAVHFANQTMEGMKPRSQWIPKLLWGDPPTVEYGIFASKSIAGIAKKQTRKRKWTPTKAQKEKMLLNLAIARSKKKPRELAPA